MEHVASLLLPVTESNLDDNLRIAREAGKSLPLAELQSWAIAQGYQSAARERSKRAIVGTLCESLSGLVSLSSY